MDERVKQIASSANLLAYETEDVAEYIDGAPHIKHAELRELYGKILLEVFDTAKKHSDPPRVADLGAGEGSVTIPFLELGAQVVAVDISANQLNTLKEKCSGHADQLEVHCQDIHDFLSDNDEKYDIIAVNSFLHHIVDYLALIDQAVSMLTPNGVFFSFQDPLRYDTLGLPNKLLTECAYFFWRISKGRKGDILGGIARRLRRKVGGVYHDDLHSDNAEYHILRGGVDHEAIEELFRKRGFDCRLIKYYSTQNSLFQPIGRSLGFKNTFAVVAKQNSI